MNSNELTVIVEAGTVESVTTVKVDTTVVGLGAPITVETYDIVFMTVLAGMVVTSVVVRVVGTVETIVVIEAGTVDTLVVSEAGCVVVTVVVANVRVWVVAEIVETTVVVRAGMVDTLVTVEPGWVVVRV